MRIIAGKYAKRRLATLNSQATRPTSDKVKESLFNSLGQFFQGGQVLDLYAGSGALGIEAVSRGMDQAVLVDLSRAACRIIKKNVALTNEADRFTVLNLRDRQALKLLQARSEQFNLVFLDPPYAKQQISQILELLNSLQLLKASAIVVGETDQGTNLTTPDGFSLVLHHQLGRTQLWFYRYQGAD
ncbi:MAG: 16S rRNA (guanine(966)-N(2))-methyltransferase RsmD [Lactobacillus sp.]|nr:16S rRNA (guanine(966)-N(2))-methyltransferase RsmD [Lactobacillus sp.]